MTTSQIKVKPLELLSPARDAEIGMLAVDHGADAVYIGGPGFGARAAAGNSLEDIERLCSYAHRYGARIFLTLNTLLSDSEIEQANAMAWQAYAAGVDAFIVQDMGLLETDMPPVEIHASTQCDIRTPEKAAFLDGLGFSQIVPARELTLEEIRAVSLAAPRARIEFFIHGALCVSYSGQCYLSQCEFGRSANRGACAQPCRLPYDVFDMLGREIAHSRHVLSLKDNDQSANLESLILAGVSSFKIEGRLKNADYVKNITAYYRRKLDAVIAKHAKDGWGRSSYGTSTFTFEPNPEKTFHRGATDYFVNGRRPMIAALDSPKSTGEVIGTVEEIVTRGQQSIIVNAKATVANGDGLVYLDSKDSLSGLSANRVVDEGDGILRIFLREPLSRHPDLTVGTVLNRNKDRLFAKLLDAPSARRTLSVNFAIRTKGGLMLEASSSGLTVAESADFACEPSKDLERGRNAVSNALHKTGDTMFECASISIDGTDLNKTASVPFLPASVLNGLRRSALAALTEKIETSYKVRDRLPELPDTRLEGITVLDWRGNVLNSKAEAFWNRHGVEVTERAMEGSINAPLNPERELMRCRHCIRHTLKICPRMVKGDAAAKEAFKEMNGGHLKPEPLRLVGPKGLRLIARFDCKACEMTVHADTSAE